MLLVACGPTTETTEAATETAVATEVVTEAGAESTETETEAAQTTEEGPILFNGSPTLAPVITQIATNFNDANGSWDAVEPSLGEDAIAIYVAAGGSGQGVKAVIDGTSTFGMVAREVKDEEKRKLQTIKNTKSA